VNRKKQADKKRNDSSHWQNLRQVREKIITIIVTNPESCFMSKFVFDE